MGTLGKGKTFGSTEEVTAAKLHQLVDSGTVSNIVAADIADNTIPDAKIQSVSGAKFTNLANTPAGAGVIPVANTNACLLTGDQTIAGVKTFSSFPVTPSEAPTTDYQTANKKYADDIRKNLLHVQEEQSANTKGGTFTSGAWRTRVLNTVKTNEISGASLASNQITLPAGTYDVEASAPAYKVGRHKLLFYNVSDTKTEFMGQCAYTSNSDATSTHSFLSGRVTIASAKAFEVQHRCETTVADNGFGVESNFAATVEVYTVVKIRKVA